MIVCDGKIEVLDAANKLLKIDPPARIADVADTATVQLGGKHVQLGDLTVGDLVRLQIEGSRIQSIQAIR